MATHNSNNERIKRKYYVYLKESLPGYSEATVDAVAAALHRFEAYNKFKDFAVFHHQQAIAFKHHLAEQRAQRSGEKLSKATLYSTLAALKKFFFWLAGQPGYRSKFTYSDSDYFGMSAKDARVATARRQQKFPTLEQVKHVISTMPATTEIEQRDRALIAFTLLTGARDGAIASMKLRHVDLIANKVEQDARVVKTKFSKTFTTFFFPVGDEIRGIVAAWVTYLRQEKLWSGDDPLFPATRSEQGESLLFEAAGLEQKHWSTASPIRDIFRKAFVSAGLQYFNPHSLRDTITHLGLELCKSAEDLKSWSQNAGHEDVLTTVRNYGTVALERQGEVISGLAKSKDSPASDFDALVKAVARKVREDGGEE
jgi:integrase